MARRWHVLDALPEPPASPHDVGDFRLVAVDFDRPWPHKVGGRLQVHELCFHVVLSKRKWQPPGRHVVQIATVLQCQTSRTADIALVLSHSHFVILSENGENFRRPSRRTCCCCSFIPAGAAPRRGTAQQRDLHWAGASFHSALTNLGRTN